MSIKIENLSYTYAQGSAYEIHALKNLSLEIHDGEFIGIIGQTVHPAPSDPDRPLVHPGSIPSDSWQ